MLDHVEKRTQGSRGGLKIALPRTKSKSVLENKFLPCELISVSVRSGVIRGVVARVYALVRGTWGIS